MDPLDSDILGELGRNARISFSDLGRAVGLSTNATAARVRRLEASGIIRGYTTVLDPDAGHGSHRLEVFIDVRLGDGVSAEHFLGAAGRLSAIDDAVHITGDYDYLVHAWCADTSALDGLLRSLKRDAGAVQTQTRIALRSPSAQRPK
jgi:Lrp/AsnC family leucine-responsive transcriptional regulator